MVVTGGCRFSVSVACGRRLWHPVQLSQAATTRNIMFTQCVSRQFVLRSTKHEHQRSVHQVLDVYNPGCFTSWFLLVGSRLPSLEIVVQPKGQHRVIQINQNTAFLWFTVPGTLPTQPEPLKHQDLIKGAVEVFIQCWIKQGFNPLKVCLCDSFSLVLYNRS